MSEIIRGFESGFPPLDGYVVTGPKGGFAQLILTGPKDDPILASTQAGAGPWKEHAMLLRCACRSMPGEKSMPTTKAPDASAMRRAEEPVPVQRSATV